MTARTTRRIPIIALLACLLIVAGCENDFGEVRIYSRGFQGFDPDSMRAIFDERSLLSINSANVPPGTSCLEALELDLADLCRESNSVPFAQGIRAVLPIHKSVLHAFVRDSFEPVDALHPMKGTTIYVVDNSVASLSILRFLAQRQGLSEADYTVISTPTGEPDIILYLGPIFPASSNIQGREGYTLVSLDGQLNPDIRATREGLQFALPKIEPAVIPALTYDLPGNEQAISTVGVDALLLTRKDMPTPVIYELVKTLLQQKPRFSAIAPSYFDGVNESFDPLSLNFPLHRGARRYLERDEPSFLERYAETINMLVYLFFLLLSGLVGLARWRSRRKKNRIDVFYVKLMEIRGRISDSSAADLQHELMNLEKEAFDALVDEKLAADESFRIFTDLLARVRKEITRSTP